MKKILLLLALGSSVYLNGKEAIKPYPETLPIIERCYSLSYDTRTKNAYWVYEKITAECLNGSDDRNKCQFKEDPVIPKIFRSCLADYRCSGFDRGHLAPAANHKNAMAETFFMSNMSPQTPQFNRGYWAQLEKHVRNLTKEFQTVEVFTGPLYLPYEDQDGKKYVKYQVIGDNNVAVPTHFFKLVALKDHAGKQYDTQAYILPNEEISLAKPIEHFRTTVQQVEKASGLIFTNLRK